MSRMEIKTGRGDLKGIILLNGEKYQSELYQITYGDDGDAYTYLLTPYSEYQRMLEACEDSKEPVDIPIVYVGQVL